jgi:ABC transporter with metal-binding/Fe-S-binding domain ATP-binding protein
MRVVSLCSGGKDSVYALYIAQQYGWEVTHLVSILPKKTDSWMFHSINIQLTTLLSEALDIPLVSKETAGEKEDELKDLQLLLEPLDIDGVISGAIASEYQRTRIERICNNLKLKSFTPLWHKDQTLLLKEQIKAGFYSIIVGVYAQGFNQSWLGKPINLHTVTQLEELQANHQINISGEGGEFETLIIDGPILKRRILIEHGIIRWHRDSGSYLITKAKLQKK